MTRVGVLALQGDVREHRAMLEHLDVETVPVRTPADLQGLQGIVFPGGESTAIAHLLKSSGLAEALGELINDDFPVFGTCAGLILLSSEILYETVWSSNHQMSVDNKRCACCNRLNNEWPESDVGDKVSVHNIAVYPVCSRVFGYLYRALEVSEVGG